MWSPKIKHRGPTVGLFKYCAGSIFLKFFGWKVAGEFPEDSSFILVCAPHTSNWDVVLGIASLYVYRLNISWIGKDSLFRWPYGWMLRKLGCIGINRDRAHNVVHQIVSQFKKHEKLVIVIAPKGTRQKSGHWKSGFYHMAMRAQVPVVYGYLDYPSKTIKVGNAFIPTGNARQDMDRIREYFKDVRGKFPEQDDVIKIREEDKNEGIVAA